MKDTTLKIAGINQLVQVIQHTNQFFLDQIQRQVNTALTLRNWVIGYYIVEYEQKGEDRAEYGRKLYAKVTEKLKASGLRSVSAKLEVGEAGTHIQPTDANLLLTRLSFSHFIELIKADTFLKRVFYEIEAIKNNWSVRELERAMGSLLFERTGLSKDKQGVLEKHRKGSGLKPEDIFRNPYFLEFLGMEEKPEHVETTLEQAIIDNLQKFLLEMGSGFCFEARQRRITFDNTHYRIDLVFYHRVLKCHVLIDLKMEKFTPGDAGQMHMYLNYFKENEMSEGDNAPIGIILCTDKSETLVKYATSGLPHNVFVSKYMTNLPSEQELEKIIVEEQKKLN